MLFDLRCLVIAVLALVPATVSAADPKPTEPSKETIDALKKLGFVPTVYGVYKDGRLADKDAKDVVGYTLQIRDKTAKDAELEKLPAIEVPFSLYLSDFGMTNQGIKSLAKQKNLVELVANSSSITAASLPDVAKCIGLKKFQITAVCTDNDLKALTPLEELTDLIILGTFTKACAGTLKQFKKLTRLDIRAIPALNAGDLKELKQLEELNLIEWNDEDLKSVSEFPKLKSLSSYICSDTGIKSLVGHGSLAKLKLSTKKVTDAALTDLGTLTKLTELDISDTSITKDGVAKLKELLPKCKIIAP